MPTIEILSNETIDKIAAGEVVEKPLNVVKELVENSIDSGATAITVDIKGGGSELIRITDNGCGILASQCKTAFLRHATSKIRSIEDLDSLMSLGFRGEALSSICAVSKAEMITKTKDSLLGTRVVIEGGKFLEQSDVGAPDGTTFIIRQLFYNTPARKKFLKNPTAEGAQIEELIQKLALSNPAIAFTFILNGRTKLSTSGNGALKDVIYNIFGKEVYNSLLPVNYENDLISIKGFTAKAEFSYQSRAGELYFVNGRSVQSKIIRVAIEEVYSKYLMQHRFPFCVLDINLPGNTIDINVHPQKLEVKFSDNKFISDSVISALNDAFSQKELIPEVTVGSEIKTGQKELISEISSLEQDIPINHTVQAATPISYSETSEDTFFTTALAEDKPVYSVSETTKRPPEIFETKRFADRVIDEAPAFNQETLFEKKLINDEPLKRYNIIGQVFDTYWIITLDDDMYIVDQHAAHEKVNYERFVKQYDSLIKADGQIMNPPMIIHLSATEQVCLLQYIDIFERIGYEIEDFGQGSFAIRTVPLNLYGSYEEELFHRLLNELMDKDISKRPEAVLEKLASLSCKAAIKGGQKISYHEMEELMKQLMELENPYNCPHGRPVFIKITKTELEKKFKRIV